MGAPGSVAPEPVEPADTHVGTTDEASDEAIAEPETTKLENADACPEPLEESRKYDVQAYQAFMDKALGLPGGPDVLLAIRIRPSFQRDGALTLHRRAGKTYSLRVTRLTTNVLREMMTEMSRQQGGTVYLDDHFQEAALRNITVGTEVHERNLDAFTAKLLLRTWDAILARAAILREVGITTINLHGFSYRISRDPKLATTNSPRSGSVLDQAVSGSERLARIVDNSTPADDALPVARDELEDALARTLRKEPCLRPYRG